MTGFLAVFHPGTLLLILLGCIVGIIFGAVPGLSGTLAVALCLPFTYSMNSVDSVSVLLALYLGGVSGGLIASVLLRIPGTPGSVATIWDGGKMAENGEPHRALGIGITYSLIGNLFGVFCMAFISPQIASFARKFGPCEYAAVIFFALTLISSLSDGDMLKALISGCAGLIFAMVGVAPMDNVRRFTFGVPDLNSGFALISMMIGFFAITEVVSGAVDARKGNVQKAALAGRIKGLGFTLREFAAQIWNTILACVVGLGIGILPGIGASSANIIAYVTCKSASRHPERYGTGSMDGIIASEASNNACCGGTLIPLISLGIPGDACTAILLGGLMIHGVVPGPQMFQNNGDLINAMIAAMIVASILIFLLQIGATRFFVRMLSLPKNILLSIVACLCVVGAFTNNSRIFDVYSILLFGFIGFLFRKLKIPAAPFMLGFVLENYFETYFRRAIATYAGDLTIFFTRPISAVFIIVGIASMIWRLARSVRGGKAPVSRRD
ncbi:MAG: tripartite tricarboxylate transporter permease [Fretibacterium sp.]|nr:tripartite tricarboxylate transporter permease [Fretibacterium sp.]